jgi:putative transposase
MGYLKGKLATRILRRYEKLGKQFWGRHLWSRGYCVSTIGIEEEKIRQYVRWQENKEKEIEDTQGELFDEEEG